MVSVLWQAVSSFLSMLHELYGPRAKCGPRSHFVNDEKFNVEKKLRNVFTKNLLIW